MAAFISTVKFTEQGVMSIGETTLRAAAFKTTAKKLGVKVIAQYWTLGQFDGVLIFDAPDEATATAAMLQLGSQCNVHTSTMRAFIAPEMDKILAAMGKSKA
jgi:uncharacterized protein with GYD domain